MTEAVMEEHGKEDRAERLLLMDYEKNCFECRHFHSDEQTCDAFPSGIPTIYLYGDEMHVFPHIGDHGIRFEQVGRRAI